MTYPCRGPPETPALKWRADQVDNRSMSRTVRLRVAAALAVATVVLLAVATAGALQLRSEDGRDEPEALMPAGSSSELAAEGAPTTLPPDAGPGTAPTAMPAADAAPPTAASPAAAPTAANPAIPPVPPPGLPPGVSPPPLPTPPIGLPPTAGLQRTFTISPTSGPGSAGVTASGTGCTGPSARVSIRVDGPDGLPYSANAGSASAGGAWSFPFSIRGGAPGVHTVTAGCSSGDQLLFLYPPQAFTVTG